MSYFDTGNDVYECTTVYLCKKCEDAKPLEDFYNKWDDKTNEEIYDRTCKECREKTKATKERNKDMSTTRAKKRNIMKILFLNQPYGVGETLILHFYLIIKLLKDKLFTVKNIYIKKK